MQSFVLPEIPLKTELCDFARIVSTEILFYTTVVTSRYSDPYKSSYFTKKEILWKHKILRVSVLQLQSLLYKDSLAFVSHSFGFPSSVRHGEV